MEEEEGVGVEDERSLDKIQRRLVDASIDWGLLVRERNALSNQDVSIATVLARSERRGSPQNVSPSVRDRLLRNELRAEILLGDVENCVAEIELIREEASGLGLELQFDRFAREMNLTELEQRMVWVFLAAMTLGNPALTKREVAQTVSTGLTEQAVACHRFDNGPLVNAGLIEVVGKSRREDTYAATALLARRVLPGIEDAADVDFPSDTQTATTEEPRLSYTGQLDLIASLAAARLVESQRRRPNVRHSEESHRVYLRRSRDPRRSGRLFEEPDIESGEDLDELARRVAAERESERWRDSSLARLSEAHDLDEIGELILVYLAVVGPRLEDEGEDSDDPRLGWQSEENPGVLGEDLLAIIGNTRAERLEARYRLYPESSLRRSGLVEARGGRQGSPETMRFGVSESTVRAILGHSAVEGNSKARRPTTSVSTGLVHRSTPTITLDDVVLPPATREAIEISLASFPLDEASPWNLDESAHEQRGLTIVLQGPSGTGKTQTTKAITGELGLPLLEVDVSKLLSPWVGMTQKNISKIFGQAARMTGGAVLFFDEADSLFFDRAGAVRSWEVQDVNVLLREIERHDGIVVLATNRCEALERALSRRVDLTLELPKPGTAERLALWRLLLPSSAHLAADVDVTTLAATAELTGGEIRKAVQEAVRRARYRGANRLDQATLLDAVFFARSGRWGDDARRPAGFGV